jgi:hypothetical protein
VAFFPRIQCAEAILLDLESGIDSLTNFKRNTADYLQQLHQSGAPLVLTVNGFVPPNQAVSSTR